MSDAVTLTLSGHEALVLFECLARWEAAGDAPDVVDPAEQIVLWALQCQLERTLVEPFDPNYQRLIEHARAVVRGESGS